MLKQIVRLLVRTALRTPKTVVCASFVLAAVSLFLTMRLTLTFGLADLLPKDFAPLAPHLIQSTSADHAPHPLLGFFVRESGRNILPYQDMVIDVQERLKALPTIRAVQMGFSDASGGFKKSQLIRYLPMYLSPAELSLLEFRLSDAGISQVLSKRITPTAGFIDPTAWMAFIRDPLNVHELALPHLERGFLGNDFFRLHEDGRYFLSTSQRVAFFIAEPTAPPWDIEFSKQLRSQLDDVSHTSAEDFYSTSRREPGLPTTPLERISPQFTGTHLVVLEDYLSLVADVKIMIAVSLVGLLLIFWIAFHRIRYLPYAVAPVLVATLTAFALVQRVYGSINIITCVAAMPLMGLGIDFSIHFVHRFLATENPEDNAHQRILNAALACGPAMIVAGLTTAGTFLLMCLATFAGFRQFGLILGCGILFNLVLVLTLLPSLLLLDEQSGWGSRHTPRQTIPGVDRVVRTCVTHPVRTILVFAALCLPLAGYASGVRMNPLFTAIHARGNQALERYNAFEKSIGVSTLSVRMLVEDVSLDRALETNAQLEKMLTRMQREGKIALFETLSFLIPPASQQQQAIAHLDRSQSLDPEIFLDRFRRGAEKSGVQNPEWDKSYLPLLAEMLKNRDIMTPKTLRDLGLSRLVDRYLHQTEQGVQIITHVYPGGRRFDDDIEQRFVNDASRDPLLQHGKVQIVGSTQMNIAVKKLFQQDTLMVTALSGVMLLMIMWIYFRTPFAVAAVFIPLSATLSVALAIFRLSGEQLTFASTIWVPLILGIAIDHSIYIVDRFKQKHEHAAIAISGVAKPIIFTSLTTIIAFGAMLFARLSGLRSTGVLVCLGMMAALLTAFTLLPALLTMMVKEKS